MSKNNYLNLLKNIININKKLTLVLLKFISVRVALPLCIYELWI